MLTVYVTTSRRKDFTHLQSIEADQPWDHVQIDLVGPLPTSKEGHTYIMTSVDVMTGYVLLHALQRQINAEVSQSILESNNYIWTSKDTSI